MLIRNDIKYNLIKPFWLVVKVVMFVWRVEVEQLIKKHEEEEAKAEREKKEKEQREKDK